MRGTLSVRYRVLLAVVSVLLCVAGAAPGSAAGVLNFPTMGTINPAPAATLLFPYFEVDVEDPAGPTTVLRIQNSSAAATNVQLTLWTDMAVPVHAVAYSLAAFAQQTVNVRDLLVSAGASVQQAHLGQPSSLFSGQCAGFDFGDRIARGYATVDVIGAIPSDTIYPGDPGYFISGGAGLARNENLLTGETGWFDPGNNFAQADTAVHIEAQSGYGAGGRITFYGREVGGSGADDREPLATAWATGYLDDLTDLVVWRDTGVPGQPFACGSRPAWYPMDQAQLVTFDAESNPMLGVSGILGPPSESLTPDGVLEAGETWTYNMSYTVTQADIDAGEDLINSASVSTDQVGVPRTDTAATPVDADAALTILKTQFSGPNPATAANDELGYWIVVTNTGNVDQTNVNVSDRLPDGSVVTPTGPTESLSLDGVLQVGETWYFETSYMVTQADIAAGEDLINSASVSSLQTPEATTDTAVTPIDVDAALTIVKTQVAGPKPATAAGDELIYRIVVTNTGSVDQTNVDLSDTLPDGSAAKALRPFPLAAARVAAGGPDYPVDAKAGWSFLDLNEIRRLDGAPFGAVRQSWVVAITSHEGQGRFSGGHAVTPLRNASEEADQGQRQPATNGNGGDR